MAQTETIARMRAATALENVTDSGGDHVMHIGQYKTSYGGSSITSVLGDTFVRRHGLKRKEVVNQFFDPETGALVIIPEKATEDCPSMGGD